DQTNFSKVLIVDDLSATFPAPSAFTVIAAPSSISGSGLVLNQNFNGSTQKNLTIDTLSSLSAGQSASFAFTLRVSITSFYKAFNNSAIGSAVNGFSAIVRDSSNAGANTEVALNIPTPI